MRISCFSPEPQTCGSPAAHAQRTKLLDLQSKREFPTEFFPSFPPPLPSLPSTPNRRLLRFGWEQRFVEEIPTNRVETEEGQREEGAEVSFQPDSAELQTPTARLESCVRRGCREGSALRREMRSNPIPPARSGVLLLT